MPDDDDTTLISRRNFVILYRHEDGLRIQRTGYIEDDVADLLASKLSVVGTTKQSPRRTPRQDSASGVVYFVRERRSMAIKIGYTANLKERLSTLSSCKLDQLELVASIPGSFAVEKAVQRHFAAFRIRGEWFEPCPELVNLIDGIAGGSIGRAEFTAIVESYI